MLHYQWKIEGDKIYFLHCDSSGFKVGNSDWEESSFKYIDGSTIEIGGLIYIKE
ncbi:MAG: hypothetical protein GY679_01180 [Mycoplasma sp.]|nr:hypothetical protein [Mycoplasma sp.]